MIFVSELVILTGIFVAFFLAPSESVFGETKRWLSSSRRKQNLVDFVEQNYLQIGEKSQNGSWKQYSINNAPNEICQWNERSSTIKIEKSRSSRAIIQKVSRPSYFLRSRIHSHAQEDSQCPKKKNVELEDVTPEYYTLEFSTPLPTESHTEWRVFSGDLKPESIEWNADTISASFWKICAGLLYLIGSVILCKVVSDSEAKSLEQNEEQFVGPRWKWSEKHRKVDMVGDSSVALEIPIASDDSQKEILIDFEENKPYSDIVSTKETQPVRLIKNSSSNLLDNLLETLINVSAKSE
eukprot:NODE_199_length_13192_cov_0.539219.p7 type:complete len:296 gc:universal NODE_199_length_13192_cov_0.539219:4667-3780(-)